MKRLSIILFISLFFNTLNAQVARWAVHPEYDDIEILNNNLYRVSKDGKYGVVNDFDKEILPIKYDSITDFRNGMALILNKKDKFLIGYTDTLGHIIDVSQKKYMVDSRCPYFNDNYLLVYNEKTEGRKIYYFIKKGSEEPFGPFVSALPMVEGYAPVSLPLNSKRPLESNTISTYFSAEDGHPINFSSDVSVNDIKFLSSSHNGKSIMVFKKYFYEYNFSNGSLTRLSIDGSNNKKSFVQAQSSRDIYTNPEDGGFNVEAVNAMFHFDPLLRLTSRQYVGGIVENFPVQNEVNPEVKTLLDLLVTDKSIKVGLTYEGNEILPQQFDEVKRMYGSIAIVKKNGKCGVIRIEKNSKILFKLNDGKDVSYEHQTHEANLIASLPPFIKASKAKIESSNPKCQIKIETRSDNENIEATSISYGCDLIIPEEITETLSPYNYLFSVIYDGLTSKQYTVTLNEWFIKGYEVVITDYIKEEGVVTVNFETVKATGTDRNHFQKTVEVEPELDEHLVKTEKVSEDSYIARIYGVNSPNISFNIDITEIGCPTVSYPFTLKLSEPTAKNTPTTNTSTETKKIKAISKGGKVQSNKNKKIKIKSQNNPLFIPN